MLSRLFSRRRGSSSTVSNRLKPRDNRIAAALQSAASAGRALPIEMLEGRVLLSVTSTTPVPFSVVENNAFSGEVAEFTANDAGPFTASINWGDGSAASAGTISPAGAGFAVSGGHTYSDDGHYTVTFNINDTFDATAMSNTTTATVFEASLSATATPFSVLEGGNFDQIVGTFTDPGSPAPASNYTATVDWGDGSPVEPGTVFGSAGNYTVTGKHSYAVHGSYTASTTFFDNDDPHLTVQVGNTVTVGALFVVTMTGPTQPLTEGGMMIYPVSVSNNVGFDLTDVPLTDVLPAGSSFAFATFSQGGPFTASGQTMTGDLGTIPTGATVNGFIIAQALEEGLLTNSVSAGVDTSAPVSTLVLDAPLTPINGKGISTTEGKSFTAVVGSFSDADPNGVPTDYSSTINWGDGTSSAGTIVPDGAGFDVVGIHTYAAFAANVPITTSVADIGGSTATLNDVAHVADAPLTGAKGTTLSGFEGRTLNGTVATFADGNAAELTTAFTASVNWGDGHTTTGTVHSSGGGKFVVTGSHAYAEESSSAGYTVKVSIHDTGGSSASTSGIAKIADSPLDTAKGFTITQSANSTFTRTLGSFRDQDALNTNAGDYSGTIDWGDGAAKSSAKFVFTGATANSGSFWNVQGSHKYTTKKTYTVKITLHDDGNPGANLVITAFIKVV